MNLGCILNFSFLGNVEVRKIDVLRVGGSVAEPMCWVGRLRSLCVGWVGVDTEINAKPAQAEAGVGAGAELGNNL